MPNFPVDTYGGVTGKVRGEDYICGGMPYSTRCFNINTGQESFSLLHKRYYAASVNINDKLYIFGGVDTSGLAVGSFEIISDDFHTQKNMPLRWGWGCANHVDENTVMISGGYQNGVRESKTWLFDVNSEQWRQGPKMNIPRDLHGCGLVKSINRVAVFGGYTDKPSTELLNVNNGQSTYGKNKKKIILPRLNFAAFSSNKGKTRQNSN